MKLTPQDYKKLKLPLGILLACLILIGALAYYTDSTLSDKDEKLKAERAQLVSAKQKYQASDAEKALIVKYLPIYQQLIKDGFVGEERRIEWVDNLRSVHRQNKLFDISYTISQQEDYKPEFTLNTGNFKLKHSVMHIDLAMLHELDILTFLDGLHAIQPTPFLTKNCEISKQTNTVLNAYNPNLLAKCDLEWITLHEPENVLMGTK